ncbi:MAG: hypothetical protein RIT19_781 [Verrucomicrobiota bacterium]|jgi:hypothetical protein
MNLLKHSVLIGAASLMVGSSAFALTSTESQALTQKILASKVIDMPAVAAKMVVSADKADRVETAKAAVVAVAKNHPNALSTVVGAVLRKAPEATEAVVAACLEVAPQMARTVVAAATFATEGQDEVILATADRLVPAQKAEVRGEVTLAKARRTMKDTSARTAKTINIPGSTAIVTTPVTDNKGNPLPPPTKISAYAGADPNRP